MLKKLLALLGFAACSVAGAASATPLTLQNPAAVSLQQQLNRPCVIGDPSCKNGSFPFTLIPNGPGDPGANNYDLNSPSYLVGTIRSMFGNTFAVGIDVNSAGLTPTETLNLFTADISGTPGVDFTYTGPTLLKLGGTPGNGFSDVLILGFDLTGFSDAATITFRAVLKNGGGGKEEYFLVAGEGGGGPNVPEPASLAILGAGMLGLGLVRRMRRL